MLLPVHHTDTGLRTYVEGGGIFILSPSKLIICNLGYFSPSSRTSLVRSDENCFLSIELIVGSLARQPDWHSSYFTRSDQVCDTKISSLIQWRVQSVITLLVKTCYAPVSQTVSLNHNTVITPTILPGLLRITSEVISPGIGYPMKASFSVSLLTLTKSSISLN